MQTPWQSTLRFPPLQVKIAKRLEGVPIDPRNAWQDLRSCGIGHRGYHPGNDSPFNLGGNAVLHNRDDGQTFA